MQLSGRQERPVKRWQQTKETAREYNTAWICRHKHPDRSWAQSPRVVIYLPGGRSAEQRPLLGLYTGRRCDNLHLGQSVNRGLAALVGELSPLLHGGCTTSFTRVRWSWGCGTRNPLPDLPSISARYSSSSTPRAAMTSMCSTISL